MTEKKILEVKKLKKLYGSIEAVNGISFDIFPNEIFALIGPNGAGKSTTLRMVATILEPSGGTIMLDGVNAIAEPDRVRTMITYLPEEAGAYKNLSGWNYLKLMASLFSDDPVKQKQSVARAAEITGLKDRLKSKIGTYSKGMTRKILLARTVMIKPTLAILDEPTSGLDVINALEIRQTIRDLAAEGMSVLLSSHNMLEIEYLSDRVGIISNGVLHEIGEAQALKTKYKTANLEEVFREVVK